MYIPAPRSLVARLWRKRARERRKADLVPAARGLVYSRASDDNVHAALNLSLLPPSLREPGSPRFPFSSFFFTFALYHIPFLPSYVPECRVALRPVLSAFLTLSLFSASAASIFCFFFRLCSYFMHAGVSSRRGESTYNSRHKQLRGCAHMESERLCYS